MKKLLTFLTVLMLAACKQDAGDGYFFEKGSQRLQPERQIVVVLYPSSKALKSAYAATPNGRVLKDGEDLQAFSTIGPKTCTIRAVDPAVDYNPSFLGHELTHCLYGEWHPSQNERV